MIRYNILQEKGPYQQFFIELKNNVLTIYDFGGYEDRNTSTIKLLLDGIKSDESAFIDKNFQAKINTSDQIYNGMLGFASENDKYKAIPCFSFDGWRQVGIDGFENTVNLIKREAEFVPISNKLFWAGSVGPNVPVRMKYQSLAKSHNEKLLCNSIEFIRDNPEKLTAVNFISLPEHCNYKYLIDLEGVGWSARLKYLCFTKRVLFINKRPYHEFWMDGLKDFENCIFVERDLSDLVDKINYIEDRPELYSSISNKLFDFAENTFTKENINKHIVKVFKNLI